MFKEIQEKATRGEPEYSRRQLSVTKISSTIEWHQSTKSRETESQVNGVGTAMHSTMYVRN
jgi:hypothetical protein